MTNFGEQLNKWVEVANANPPDEYDTKWWLEPVIEGFIEGSVICFWVLMATTIFMRIFKHKELGWVDIVK